jgi:hypothetical protein
MRKVFQFTVPALVLGLGLAVNSVPSFGKPEYTKQTKKACAVCHVDSKAKPKELTEAGKYFKEKKTLDGFDGK